MPNKQKITITILVLLALVGAGGVLYALFTTDSTTSEVSSRPESEAVAEDVVEGSLKPSSQQEPTSTQPNSIEEISFEELMDTSTWKTYENEDLGVRFMYPENWTVEFDHLDNFDTKIISIYDASDTSNRLLFSFDRSFDNISSTSTVLNHPIPVLLNTFEKKINSTVYTYSLEANFIYSIRLNGTIKRSVGEYKQLRVTSDIEGIEIDKEEDKVLAEKLFELIKNNKNRTIYEEIIQKLEF